MRLCDFPHISQILHNRINPAYMRRIKQHIAHILSVYLFTYLNSWPHWSTKCAAHVMHPACYAAHS